MMSLSISGKSSSLKAGQLKAIYRMLAFNQDIGDDMVDDGMDKGYGSFGSGISIPPAGSSHNQWKILVYDKVCRSIISPLVSVSQLRRRGVTLHLLINSEREPIPDVPVVYFVAPTKENLAIIAKDCAKKLYGRAYINFVTKLDRSLMEEFASLVVQSGSLDSIASIHDQYLDYVCLERRLFTLNKPNSYAIYNKTDATQETIESFMTSIAHGLFSVVATMGSIPIIRCPKNGAPEMVARKLYKMIVDHPTLLRNKKSSMASGNYRPLLVLLDRSADLITPCQHTSTYQALIDDVLDHRVNRVDFDVNTDNTDSVKKGSKQHKRFDLDPDTDTFYCQHKFQPFPEAIESNSVELQEVTEREQEIRSKATSNTSSNEINDDPLFNPSANATDSLANAVDSLPALLDRKKQLEMHTSILQAVMNEVAARDIPPFFEQESSLATGTYKNDQDQAKTDILQIISDPQKGTIQDKVRLILVYCLATKATTADLDEVIQSLEKAIELDDEKNGGKRKNPNSKKNEDGVKAISYIRQLRSMNMLSVQANSTETVSDGVGSTTAGLSSFMAKTATGLLAKATDRVSNILGKIHKHYATRVIENLCEMKNNTEDDDYLYLDPRVKGDIDIAKLKSSSGSTSSMTGVVAGSIRRAPIKDVVCFVIGGGSYGEYQNLQMLAKSDDEQGSSISNTSVSVGGNLRGGMASSSNSKTRSITYGSTEIMDAESFVSQLGQLG